MQMTSQLNQSDLPKPFIGIDVAIEDDRWRALVGIEALVQKSIEAAIVAASPDTGDISVSVMFCDDASIQEINLKWRKINKPTNVLSFPALDFPGRQGPIVLGDIVVAFETCEREAADGHIPVQDHVSHLLVHGCLHLLGFDHEISEEAEEMEAMEVEILSAMGVPNPYAGLVLSSEGVQSER